MKRKKEDDEENWREKKLTEKESELVWVVKTSGSERLTVYGHQMAAVSMGQWLH